VISAIGSDVGHSLQLAARPSVILHVPQPVAQILTTVAEAKKKLLSSLSEKIVANIIMRRYGMDIIKVV
jgi:hypothetical protein